MTNPNINILNQHPAYRAKTILESLPTIDNNDKAEFIKWWWEGAEFPSNQDSTWRKIFAQYPKENFDTPIEVYRGGSSRGFSWTTDLEMAKWFSNRNHDFEIMYWRAHNIEWAVGPGLWRAVVNPRAIIFITNDRGENEVVIKYWLKTAFLESPTRLSENII